jgi:amino acid transporter
MGGEEIGSGPRLERRLGLLQSTALNMANMVGVGPFLTIPLIVKELPGPQVMVGWGLGLLLALADAMVWCELGAALPGSGGTYHYLREVFRSFRVGRILPFLFIWQFIFSGPLEVATGCIGLARYLDVLWPSSWGPLLTPDAESLSVEGKLAASLAAVAAVLLLYRRIGSVGKLTVLLWAGMLATVSLVIFTAACRFSPALAFARPPAGPEGGSFGLALGAALGIAMYDFLGYYDICYLGDEVREPARTIPRAVVISVLGVAAIYAVMNVSILGVLPVEQVKRSSAIAVDLVREVWSSPWLAGGLAALIVWTAFASVFALLLGYSRIPFAAARDGYFFSAFADLHPREGFPRLSLVVLGLVTVVACWFDFGDVLEALLTSRILVQFVAQIAAVITIRQARLPVALPFRMWLYPLPCLCALLGWLYIFGTTRWPALRFGLVTLAVGVAAYFALFRPWRRGKAGL